MLQAGHVGQNDVVLVNANQPINKRNEGGQKNLKRRNTELHVFREVGIAR